MSSSRSYGKTSQTHEKGFVDGEYHSGCCIVIGTQEKMQNTMQASSKDLQPFESAGRSQINCTASANPGEFNQ